MAERKSIERAERRSQEFQLKKRFRILCRRCDSFLDSMGGHLAFFLRCDIGRLCAIRLSVDRGSPSGGDHPNIRADSVECEVS